MENASKALLMAAGVLIGMLIISLGVYLFVSFSDVASERYEENKQQQIEQYNAQFTSMQGKDCTIYDVVSLINLATESNKYYGYDKRTSKPDGKNSYISIYIGNDRLEYGIETSSDKIVDENNQLIIENNTIINPSTGQHELKKYRIKQILISQFTYRVYKVEFEEI